MAQGGMNIRNGFDDTVGNTPLINHLGDEVMKVFSVR